MVNERLQRELQFNYNHYHLEMPRSHAKMHQKRIKNELLMAKAISGSYTLDCSCKCPCKFLHS